MMNTSQTINLWFWLSPGLVRAVPSHLSSDAVDTALQEQANLSQVQGGKRQRDNPITQISQFCNCRRDFTEVIYVN